MDDLQAKLRKTQLAVALMWTAWLTEKQVENECDGMNTPGKRCGVDCRCATEMNRYMAMASRRPLP
ncbi:MAG: hypothetical protein EHM23_00220 [Acidobacteria bacterium]|nr:MAG: hypothetical protein EHM23_00220 [Acidobacteriota bacterium]